MMNLRKSPRVPMIATATLRLRHGDNEREYLALNTSNISHGGAYFRSDAHPPVGACGKVEIVLHSSAVKVLTGQPQFGVVMSACVTRTSSEGFAVIFDHSDDSAELAA